MIKYQITFCNCVEGSLPQRDEICDTKEEAMKVADDYNRAQGLGDYGNANACYSFREIKVKGTKKQEEMQAKKFELNHLYGMRDMWTNFKNNKMLKKTNELIEILEKEVI